MKESWVLKNKTADFKSICEKHNVSSLIARLLVNKGLTEDVEIDKFLNPNLNQLHSYKQLKDVNKAISIIAKAIDNGEKIRVVGDYDVDGITSTYIFVTALEELGGFVSYKIPDRITEGYGINRSIIESAINDGIDLIVTCDNGIAAYDQIAYAKENGVSVVVTDHHNVPDKLPPADAVVNPKQSDCTYPLKEICGAVVAAKVCEGLFEYYGYGSFIEKHLDVMAIATVCDVMNLVDENRVIVKYGLEAINQQINLGFKALINETGLVDKEITTYHLGFVLGPCLNATGRLETADAGVELLKSTDYSKALELAKHLKTLNEERKEKTVAGVSKCINIIEDNGYLDDSVLVIYVPNCHESIAGIIAGRVKEAYNRPSIVFTDSTSDSEVLKGSARSIEEYNIYEKLKEQESLILKFGGHPGAAGLGIERSKLEELRIALNKASGLDISKLEKKISIDISVAMSSFEISHLEEMKVLEPFGNGNEKPVFADRNVSVSGISRFGKEGNFLLITMTDSAGNTVTGKMFNKTDKFIDDMITVYGQEKIDEVFAGNESVAVNFIYSPEINEYRNRVNLQYNINSYMIPGMPDNSAKQENQKKN